MSFLILAIVVFLQPRGDRMLPFASELWLLGIFGSLHGIKEWLDAWMLLNRAEGAGLHRLNACILVLSYLALFEFGRRLATICAVSRSGQQSAWLGPWVYLPLLGGVYATTSVADDAARGLSAGGRIFFGFSGGVLSGISLAVRGCVCGWPVLPETKPYFYAAAGALIIYAVGAGLVVEGDAAFPDWLPTTGSFFAAAGIPVQFLRGLCVFVLTFALVIITRSVNVVARKQEEAARAETAALTASLAQRVRESTVSLEAANRRLLKEIKNRTLIEHDLSEREADLRRARSVAHVGSWHLDVPNNTLRGSAETYRIFDMQEATPLALEDFLKLVHPEDRGFVERSWQAALRGEPYDVEHRIVVAGEVRWVRERAELEFDLSGRPVAGTGIVQDITQHKLAEDEVRHAKELIQLVVDSIPVYVALVDCEQRYVLVNRGYEDWFQRSRGEIIGKLMSELMDSDIYEQAKPHVRAALSGEAARFELQARNSKGLPRWLDI